MSLRTVKKLLKQRESIRLEFKEAYDKMPSNLFETICAFLNRDGGDILLGVRDDGEISGINSDEIDKIKSNIANLSNNPQKIDPPFILFPEVIQINKKNIIHIQVPQSSQVHKTDNTVFDRSNDGDFRIKLPEKIAEIYNTKRIHYTEGTVYPFLTFEDFKKDLFIKIRNLIRSKTPANPWLSLSDKDILLKAGLKKKDYFTGKEGYTLAAALLFGKDEVILNIIPHYKIDALVRRENVDRYDDRLIIQTNLIEAYEHLIDFTAKHLPDKFYMEGDIRISLREKIFREVISNLIVHREYTNAYPATFTIYKDCLKVCNANNPHGKGPLHLDSFTPFPKNPYISKFFIQLGRAEELGSGIISINKYLKEYARDAHPEFIEDDIFTTVIPLIPGYQAQVEAHVEAHVDQVEAHVDLSEAEWNILRHSLTREWNVKELMKFLGINSLSGSLKKSIKKLRENGYLQYTVINKPRSSKQRYKITQKGKDRITIKLNANDERC